MKILIVSSWADDESMYPHLRFVLENLKHTYKDVEYFYFFQRGYSFANDLSFNVAFKLWKGVFKNLWKLKLLYLKNKFDKIIVIDHFTYVCANFILPKDKLIFWSFDIMGDDSTYYKYKFIRFMLSLNAKFLKAHPKLIIQNQERLQILERTLRIKLDTNNVCFLPVFIEKLPHTPSFKFSGDVPKLLQCTGFDGQRYTEELIEQYQKDSQYSLYLHGIQINTIEDYISRFAKKPSILHKYVLPNKVFEIVESSDIGFLGMKLKEDNCKCLYGASGQLLEFLRCGKPVISFGDNNVGKVLEKHKAGIEIKNIEELEQAVLRIKNDYETYARNAYSLFLKDFCSNKLIKNLLKFLENI